MPPFRFFDDQLGERLLNIPLPLVAGTAPTLIGIATMTAAADPGVNQDISQGYVVGSALFNATAGQLRWWECRDNTLGAAKWVYSGADYANGGTNPSSEITQFGGAPSAQMAEEGNINRQISAAGVQPGSTGADIVLAFYALPAAAFDILGRGLNIVAQGSVANNTNTKTLKIIVSATLPVIGSAAPAGTTIASLVTNTSAGSGGWQLEANIFKYGAAGSNTQMALHVSGQAGNVPGALVAPSALTLTESAIVYFVVSGNAATTATDITQSFFEANAMN